MTQFPRGPSDPLFGAFLAKRFIADPLSFITELGQKYGDIAYFRLGWIRTYFLNQPDLIREVLTTKAKCFRKLPKQVNIFRQIDGNGLVNSEGEFWLRQRRLVQPALHPKRMSRYAQVMVESTQQYLKECSEEKIISSEIEMTQLALTIIAKTLFGIEQIEQATHLGEAVHVLSEIFLKEITSPLPFLLPKWLPLPHLRRKRRAIQTLDQAIWKMIRKWRDSGEDKGDLLSMLLLAVDEEGDGQSMTDQQVRDEAMTLFISGHDTSAASLSWNWYVIATNPSVRVKLLEEIDRVLGGKTISFEDLPQLVYTQMFIKEVLRFYPPAWGLIIREAITEVELGGYRIPKGSWIEIFPYALHRHPRYFPNPEEFRPERFAPHLAEPIPQYAYIPFGGGPHICIGQHFAMTEMMIILVTVLQQFYPTLDPQQKEVELEPFLSLRPKGGLKLRFHKRSSL